jgi:predicted N-acetyltransferase YhbS
VIETRRIPYDEAPADLRRQFFLMRSRAGLPERLSPDGVPAPLHDPALDAVSFYACDGGEIVSYAAVVRKSIGHAGQAFEIAGLSAVVTDPRVRGRGFGLGVVRDATRWMERSGAHLGIFTCDPPLAGFYERAGAWPVAPDVVLVGNRSDDALRSDTLGKVVLMRLFTESARAAAPVLTHATIALDLPAGQFL